MTKLSMACSTKCMASVSGGGRCLLADFWMLRQTKDRRPHPSQAQPAPARMAGAPLRGYRS
jgi:hypothetical protein